MKVDLIANLVLLIVGISLLYVLSDYPDMARRFPQLTLIVLIILISLDILKKIRTAIWVKPLTVKDDLEAPLEDRQHIRALYMLGFMFTFFFFMRILGFTLGTFIFLFICTWALGYRRIKPLILSTVIITGSVYIIFISIMDSYLPRSFILDILGR